MDLIPIRFLSPENRGALDAVTAFQDNILTPVIAERAAGLNIAASFTQLPPPRQNFHQGWPAPAEDPEWKRRQGYAALVRRLLIGERGPKAFRDSIEKWHRGAAAVSALRHENSAARPGWPGLCDAWTSGDRRSSVTALTTAAGLVAEGNAMHHCVGGYYNQCRTGLTQILSLRHDGERAATVEIFVDNDFTLRVGQFEGPRRIKPGPDIRAALREFLADLRQGRHPMNREAIQKYRQSCQPEWQNGAPLSVDHARAAFGLFLPLLPRGTPASLDDWRIADQVDEAIDGLLLLPGPSVLSHAA